ncbi:MAG: 3-isopropylmalate dehydratase small subunit [Pyrinomonadaceae bacterium]
MRKFETFRGKVVPLFRANIDTDQIIPKKFLLRITRTGFADALFYDWRIDSNGNEISTFVLNDARYKDGSILIGGENFGCGSSREHAPWALDDYGFRVIIAPSFADIFYNNSFKIGLLPIVLDRDTVQKLAESAAEGNLWLEIDLASQTIKLENEDVISFEVDKFRKHCLINGLDDIGLTLVNEQKISEFECGARRF